MRPQRIERGTFQARLRQSPVEYALLSNDTQSESTMSTDHPQESNAKKTSGANSRPGLILAAAGLLVLCGILYWGFVKEPATAPVSEQTPATPETPPIPAPAEVIDAPEPEFSTPAKVAEEPIPDVPPIPPAITLAESDGVIAEGLPAMNSGPLGEQFVMRPNNVERGIAIIDNLRQGAVPYKLLPVGRPNGAFAFQDNGLAVTMNPAGFSRYDALANTVAGIDVEATLALYDVLAVAIEGAWSALGYTDVSFQEATLGALGMVMLAPAPNLEARLLKDESNWVYEDASLESLPPLQKQIMRMGPENAEKIQDKAREFRAALLDRSE